MLGIEVRLQAGTGKELDSNLGRVSTYSDSRERL